MADLVVYASSEAVRWGIPLERILHTVMDSQVTKLVAGKPIKCVETNKFLKGPNYVPPEEKIRDILFPKEEDGIPDVVGVKAEIKRRCGFDGWEEYVEASCSSCSTLINDGLFEALAKEPSRLGFKCVECHQQIGRV